MPIPPFRRYACVCGAKLFSKMLSGGQNPQLHTVTLHLVCGIRNGGRELKKRGGGGHRKKEARRENDEALDEGKLGRGMVGKRDRKWEKVWGRNVQEKDTN